MTARRASAAARWASVVAFVAILGGGWLYHRARAQVSENLFSLGAQMMRYRGARHQDAPRELELNGQVIHFTSGTADRTADEVLDFFEARCAEVDGALPEQLAALPHRGDRAAGGSSPTMREGDGERGYVACLDLGARSVSVTELADRIRRFGRTSDVSDIGEPRYVFAEQYEVRGRARTHFVALWTEGRFDVGRMFPPDGDVPGSDGRGVPRAPDTRRVLSGRERGGPYSLAVYESRGDERDLARFYRAALPEHGWTLVEARRPPPGTSAPTTLLAERRDELLTIVLATDLERGTSSAAVFHGR